MSSNRHRNPTWFTPCLRETQERRWREELGRKEMMALDEVAMQIAFGQTAGGHESEHA